MIIGFAVSLVILSGALLPSWQKVGATGSTVITDCAQLQSIDNDLGGSYVLGGDINCSASAGWNGGLGFSPIGLAGSGFFTGTLDGHGHTISGLTISRGASSNAGLFWQANGATIHDLYFSHAEVTGQSYAGTLGAFINDSSIYNVGVENGSVVSADNASSSTGGLVGALTGDSGDYVLNHSYYSGSVSGHANTGGLAGYVSFVNIQDSYSTGSVSGSADVGGLVGQFQDFWGIASSYSHANVTASGDNAGGLVGQIGDGLHGSPFASDSYASGSVTSDGDAVGGFVGLDIANVDHCFAAGAVSASIATNFGGFVGSYSAGGSDHNVYDAQRTGQTSAGAGGITNVSAVNTNGSPDSTYFFHNFINDPLANWDTTLWFKKAANFPVLARSPHNTTSVATKPATTTIKVTWPAADDSDTLDIANYALKYRPHRSSAWKSVTIPASTSNSYTITGLTSNTPYDIVVITNIASGSSSGLSVTAKTVKAPTVVSSAQLTALLESNEDASALPASITLNGFDDFLTTGHEISGLHVGDAVHFMIENGNLSELHSATVKSISGGTVVLTIASKPFNVALNVGQTKDVAVLQNGQDDLEITLVSIANGEANLRFKSLQATSAAAPIAASTNSSVSPMNRPKSPADFAWITLTAVAILVVAAFVVWRARLSNSKD